LELPGDAPWFVAAGGAASTAAAVGVAAVAAGNWPAAAADSAPAVGVGVVGVGLPSSAVSPSMARCCSSRRFASFAVSSSSSSTAFFNTELGCMPTPLSEGTYGHEFQNQDHHLSARFHARDTSARLTRDCLRLFMGMDPQPLCRVRICDCGVVCVRGSGYSCCWKFLRERSERAMSDSCSGSRGSSAVPNLLRLRTATTAYAGIASEMNT
jgi:hypothetical protein